MHWSQELIRYEESARGLARRIAVALTRQDLRNLLLEGLFLHRERGRDSFLRAHSASIYRVVLTRRERAFVREERARWVGREALEAEIREAEGEEAVASVREWAHHLNQYHFPSTECTWCYASLLDVVLRRRDDAASPSNPAYRRPRHSNGRFASQFFTTVLPQLSQPLH